jgi:plastocyanin
MPMSWRGEDHTVHTNFRLFLLIGLLAVCNLALANTLTVQVGGTGDYGSDPVLTFSPAHITINAGDSIRFQNIGGTHNVHADDNSFRCANGCDDTGGDGSPSADWTFTRTFSTPGTIAYHCDVHVNMGMTGSITVNSVQNTINLGGYLSGNWFDPTPGQSGHGFQLEFTNQANTLLAIWFVYPPNGGGQNWIYAQGSFDAATNTATIPAILLSGPQFPPLYNNADLQQTSWGTLTFTFTDCDHGTASWNSTVAGYGSGTIPIQRITSIQGTACPQ